MLHYYDCLQTILKTSTKELTTELGASFICITSNTTVSRMLRMSKMLRMARIRMNIWSWILS